jgi:hypothetical protein
LDPSPCPFQIRELCAFCKNILFIPQTEDDFSVVSTWQPLSVMVLAKARPNPRNFISAGLTPTSAIIA